MKRPMIYDEHCAWPYVTPYGMVLAPKVKKPRKPRKSRAKPDWLKKPRKPKVTEEMIEGLGWKKKPHTKSTPLKEGDEGFAEAWIKRTQKPKPRTTFSDPIEVFLPKE